MNSLNLYFLVAVAFIGCATAASVDFIYSETLPAEEELSPENFRDKRSPGHILNNLFGGGHGGGYGGGHGGGASSSAAAASATSGSGGGLGGFGGGNSHSQASAQSNSASYMFGPFSATFSQSNANAGSSSQGGGGFFDY